MKCVVESFRVSELRDGAPEGASGQAVLASYIEGQAAQGRQLLSFSATGDGLFYFVFSEAEKAKASK
jgi:hypothetical protein